MNPFKVEKAMAAELAMDAVRRTQDASHWPPLKPVPHGIFEEGPRWLVYFVLLDREGGKVAIDGQEMELDRHPFLVVNVHRATGACHIASVMRPASKVNKARAVELAKAFVRPLLDHGKLVPLRLENARASMSGEAWSVTFDMVNPNPLVEIDGEWMELNCAPFVVVLVHRSTGECSFFEML